MSEEVREFPDFLSTEDAMFEEVQKSPDFLSTEDVMFPFIYVAGV